MRSLAGATAVFGLIAGILMTGLLPREVGAGVVSPGFSAETPNRLFLAKGQIDEASAAGMLPSGVRSLLKVDRKLRHGEFVWDERGAPAGELLIRVNLRSQMISVFRGGHEIGTSVILYGAEGYDTPLGTFPILAKLRDHRSRTYDAPMPFTLRLTADGIAIHGSNVRGGRATHGCIGVPLEFAHNLFEAANTGDEAQIVAS